MANFHQGQPDAANRRISVVAGRFNEFVTTRLVDSAVECLEKHGADPSAVDVYWVPGVFEVPQMALRIGVAGRADGIVCLGAIIRGETNNFDILSVSFKGRRLETQ